MTIVRVFGLAYALLYAVSGFADARSNVDLGHHLFVEGKLDEALEVLTSAIESNELADGELAMAHVNRSAVNNGRGEYKLAEEDIVKGLALVDGKFRGAEIHGMLWLNLGNSLNGQHRVDEAEEAHSKGLQVGGRSIPTTLLLLRARAGIRFDKEDYEGSMEDALEMVAVDDYYLPGMYRKHAVFIKAGMYDEALGELYDMARRAHDPLKVATFLNEIAWFRATCEIDRYRDGSTAVEMSKRALEVLPDSYRAERLNILDTLAASYAEADRFDKALRTVGEMQNLAGLLKEEEREGVTTLINDIDESHQMYLQEMPIRRSCDGLL